MDEKAGFEIKLKRCEHVTCVTVRTICIISISMITNPNLFIMLIPINKYPLRYSLFLKFSQALYIDWITWCTEYGTIYKNISKLKKKNIICKSVR